MLENKGWISLLIGLISFVLIIIVVQCNLSSRSQSDDKEVKVPADDKLITLIARCKAKPPTEEGRCNNLIAAAKLANAELAARGDNRRLQVKIIQDNKPWGDYKTEFELASDTGKAPDIILSGHEHIGSWAPAGLIIPLTDLLGNYPEFDEVIDILWESTEWQGDRWGIPQDAEVRLFYYSKPLLRKLGWSKQEIANLPERVARSEFTWNDMLDIAEQAVKNGVVEPGNGWWHRPRNGPDFLYYYFAHGGEIIGDREALIFDQNAALAVYQMLYAVSQERDILSPTLLGMEWNDWHTILSPAEKVLFWFGGSWNWADWATNYIRDRGGEDFLFENIGFTAIPAGTTGKPISLTHPLVYMISSQSDYPDLALLVIAKATTKELNTTYALDSGHLGILKSQADYPPYSHSQFLIRLQPLLKFTTFVPNSPYWSAWSEAYFLGIQAVESGDLKPKEALAVVIAQLENELGDNVVIR
jgi:inositol-phosphate transport system substrate-binding protein